MEKKDQNLQLNFQQQGLEIKRLSFLDKGPYTFSLKKGDCAGISGRSGVGKTLFLRAVADIIAHKGEIRFDGVCPCQLSAPEWRKKVSFVSAESFWWFDYVQDHFIVPFDDKVLVTYLSMIGFEKDVGGWQVNRLSTGEKQRLSLLRSLINYPTLLLLDEPTSGLDEGLTDSVESLVQSYQQDFNATVLWVSHSKEQLDRVADKIFIMHQSYMEEV